MEEHADGNAGKDNDDEHKGNPAPSYITPSSDGARSSDSGELPLSEEESFEDVGLLRDRQLCGAVGAALVTFVAEETGGKTALAVACEKLDLHRLDGEDHSHMHTEPIYGMPPGEKCRSRRRTGKLNMAAALSGCGTKRSLEAVTVADIWTRTRQSSLVSTRMASPSARSFARKCAL